MYTQCHPTKRAIDPVPSYTGTENSSGTSAHTVLTNEECCQSNAFTPNVHAVPPHLPRYRPSPKLYWYRKHTVLTNEDVCLLVGCLTSQQQASVSQGRICSDNFTCCHTEIEVADQTFYLTQSQYTDTGPTSPSADPITPGAWQGSHWSTNF